MKRKIVGIFICFAAVSGFAQEAVPATGGEATGSGGTVSYTVGQVAYTSKTDGTTTTSEGVQQAYKVIDDNSGIADNNISLEVVAYPNPTQDKVQLQIIDLNTQDLSYQIYDLAGKKLLDQKITTSTSDLDLGSYADGTYVLKVMDANVEIRSFKIVKN